MGLFSGLFGGGKKKSDAPVIPQFQSDPYTDAVMKSQMTEGGVKQTQSNLLTNELLGTPTYGNITVKEPIYQTTYNAPTGVTQFASALMKNKGNATPTQTLVGYRDVNKRVQTGYSGNGLLASLQKAPEFGSFEQKEYKNASDTYLGALEIARINAMNETAQSLQGMQSQFGLSGGAFGESGSRALASSMTAKNQTALNEYAMATSDKLLNFRSQLLEGVYQRLVNRYNATTSLQGQLSGQASNMINTGANYSLGLAQAKSGVNVANAQIKAQSDIAADSNKTSLGGSLLSIGGSLLGKFIGG